MKKNKIIEMATDAGKIILENGGEAYRVEETITKICSAYKIFNVNIHASPTIIICSYIDKNKEVISICRRIKSRTINFDKIHKANNLSREIVDKNLSLEHVQARLKEIEQTYSYNKFLSIIFSCFISSFFSYIFGGNLKDFGVSFIIGAVLKVALDILSYLKSNVFFTNLVSAFIVSILAYLSSIFISGVNPDKIIIGSIMILVPGIGIVNSLKEIIAGDLVSGLIKFAEAFIIAVAIAVGTGVVIKFWFLYGRGI